MNLGNRNKFTYGLLKAVDNIKEDRSIKREPNTTKKIIIVTIKRVYIEDH